MHGINKVIITNNLLQLKSIKEEHSLLAFGSGTGRIRQMEILYQIETCSISLIIVSWRGNQELVDPRFLETKLKIFLW